MIKKLKVFAGNIFRSIVPEGKGKIGLEKKAIPSFFIFLILVIIGGGVYVTWHSKKKKGSPEEISVITTTIFPIEDMVSEVVKGKGLFDIGSVVKYGESPYDYVPNDEAKYRIQRSNVVIKIGNGFDDWIDPIISGKNIVLIDLSKVVSLDEFAFNPQEITTNLEVKKICELYGGKWYGQKNECEALNEGICLQNGGIFDLCKSSCRYADPGTDCDNTCVKVCTFPVIDEEIKNDEGEETQSASDPHYWLNITNAKTIVSLIYQVVSAIKPGYAENYLNNADLYIQKLTDTDVYIRDKVVKISNKRLFTTQNNMGYFASAYGFSIIATYSPDLGQDPSEEYIKKLDKAILSYGMGTVYVDPISQSTQFEKYFSEKGLEKRGIDPFGGGEYTSSYIELMKYNIDSIAGDIRYE